MIGDGPFPASAGAGSADPRQARRWPIPRLRSVAVTAETRVSDRSRGAIGFGSNHPGFSTTGAAFETFSGTLAFRVGESARSALGVTSLNSDLETSNDHLRDNTEWFETCAHPRAMFAGTGIDGPGERRCTVTGHPRLQGWRAR